MCFPLIERIIMYTSPTTWPVTRRISRDARVRFIFSCSRGDETIPSPRRRFLASRAGLPWNRVKSARHSAVARVYPGRRDGAAKATSSARAFRQPSPPAARLDSGDGRAQSATTIRRLTTDNGNRSEQWRPIDVVVVVARVRSSGNARVPTLV